MAPAFWFSLFGFGVGCAAKVRLVLLEGPPGRNEEHSDVCAAAATALGVPYQWRSRSLAVRQLAKVGAAADGGSKVRAGKVRVSGGCEAI
eukprot:scaffold2659_cov275-Pinguiococcus_pyrenoidosus.AAC.1